MKDLIDTHCHIHDSEYSFFIDEVLRESAEQKITVMVCVGTNLRSSSEAIELSLKHQSCYASFGLHPHLAVASLKELKADFDSLKSLAFKYRQSGRLIAIGECGLDYFYHRDEEVREKQRQMLNWHLELSRDLDLPLIFHVRQAFDDFWSLYDSFQAAAVLHSFSDSPAQVNRGLKYPDLYFGLNGIMTFTKDESQLIAARDIPSSRLLLETDAPYLTPKPFRGKINKPQHLRIILDFLARLRNEKEDFLAKETTANARSLFRI